MKKFLKIILILAIFIGGGLFLARHFIKGLSPRDTVTSYTGVEVQVDPLGVYRGSSRITGRIFRPLIDSTDLLPAVIYVQDVKYGERWCKALAGKGFLCYSFDFEGDGEKLRRQDLEAVIDNIRRQSGVDTGRIYLLGESNGCKTAALTFFDHPRDLAGLILISPGFNPLELSRKARRFKGDILVVDGSQAMWNAATEIADYIRR